MSKPKLEHTYAITHFLALLQRPEPGLYPCDVRRRTNTAASLQRDLVMDTSGVTLNQTVRSHLKLVRQQDLEALLEDEHVQSMIDGLLVTCKQVWS
jgi:hypothetical protein